MIVPYFDLKAQYESIRDEVLQALDKVCRNASFVLGEEVEQFEREFAAYCETRYCVALNSGTSALHLALLGVGVGQGDEVVTSSNTFIATAEAITYTGATPVFVDINPKTANIDPKQIEGAITARTKAILPVHLYGRPADLEPILAVAERYHLPVVEDACQAHGARYHGRRVGSLGRAAAFSFYPSKNLGAYGEGGALTTSDPKIAELARSLRHHGQREPYFHDRVGYNYRMDGFQGVVLRIKLRHLEAWNAQRQELARRCRELLAGARVVLPQDDPQCECVYHLFVVYVENRDAVRDQLRRRSVQTAVHYPRPLHLQKPYLSASRRRLPHTEWACERALSMPLFPEMTLEQVSYAAQALREAVGRA